MHVGVCVKIAYLIVTHDNPAHLVRLTRALSSSASSIFIHVDQKSEIEEFTRAQNATVQFIQDRVRVFWGDFSQVEATLKLLTAALSAPERLEYFVLLSGADYPLRSASYIGTFFARHAGQEFIDIAPLGSQPLDSHLSRIGIYRSRPSDPLALRLAAKLARVLKIPLRRNYKAALGTLVPYGGSTWWALSRQACEYIQSFVVREPRVVEFFKHTRCPDEIFFQTILGNSPFKAKTLRSVTYTDWSELRSSPANICERHLDGFRSSWPVTLDGDYGQCEALFARKFSDLHPEFADRIDRMVQEAEHATAEA